MEAQTVEIAFDHHHPTRLLGGVSRQMQRIQNIRLRIKGRFRRIQILRGRITQCAPAKGDGLAPLVPDRKHQAMAKSVVNLAAVILRKQPGRQRISGSQMGHQTGRGRISQSKSFDIGLVDLAFLENLTCHGGLIRVQHLAEMGCGLFVDFKDLLPLFFPFLLRFIDTAGWLRDRNPALLRHNSDGFGKRHVLDQLHKLENISTDTAAEAVEELSRA